MTDYSKFRDSLRRLEEQRDNYRHADHSRTSLDQDGVAESVIQRFETCYAMLWKALQRHLGEELGLPNVPHSPKPIFRIAHENNLLPGDIRSWLEYADSRSATAHDYHLGKREDSLRLVPRFLEDAISLYQTLTNEKWK